MASTPVLRLNGFEDVSRHIARHIIDQFETSLPHLDQLAVFLPNSNANQYFRRCLLNNLPASAPQALIPPWIGSLEQWAFEVLPSPNPDITVISESARQLVFIQALLQHPDLFRDHNKWQVSDNLLSLFNEINLQQANIAESATDWLQTLQSAYGLASSHQHLEQEASLVHRLWYAWHEQLQASKLQDQSSAYLSRLQSGLNNLPESFYCFAVLPDRLTRAEKSFIQALQQRQQCTIIQFQDDVDSLPDENQQFIHQAFAYDRAPLKQRADTFRQLKKLSHAPYSVFLAKDAEHEARAIDLQIREWLLAGKQQIGIVCEDRKLSRRVRALLERADVPLQDMAGWSLSTTSAAAALERWLECIEEDFDHRPMLDLLKSHFFHTESREQHLQNVYRLEKDVIQHERIERGLLRYREHLAYRLQRLAHWPQGSYQNVFNLLEELGKQASKLQNLQQSNHPQALSDYLSALLDSLDQLGLSTAFNNDAAGIRIMQTLSDLQHSLQHADPELHWDDFRSWLGMSLEAQSFSPQTAASAVQLMTLEQAELKQFDGLIIAAVDPQHMPGSARQSALFNQGARQSLGLDSWADSHQQRLQIFKHLLLAAPDVLISCKAEEAGEAIPLSPWVESLKHFHQLGYESTLVNQRLSPRLEANPGVFICDSPALPEQPVQARPSVKHTRPENRLSASAHQRLLDCPYRFFAADELGLRSAEEISEELKKSDYGERIHLILQAFHQQTDDYPAPFTATITAENRDRAIRHLEDLSAEVFKQNLEDNLLHRSWLHRWRSHIPAYIDWQIKHQNNWCVAATELKLDVELENNLSIFGRLDRLDRSNTSQENENLAIIDYKTGRAANQAAVDSGEDVQLVSYALLEKRASEVSYLLLDESNGKVRSGASLSDESLDDLKIKVQQRLSEMISMKDQGYALTAWGDESVCHYCDFDGLCRRAVWRDAE